MSTSTLSRSRSRVLAAVTAAALGAGTLAAGVALTTSSAAADEATPEKAVVSVVKDTTDETGMTVRVTGSGFDPDLALGTRPPLQDQPSGTYVGFGKFADVWQPSASAASSARTLGDNLWVTPSGAYGGVLNADGTFAVDIEIDPTDAKFDGLDGNWGIYTYAGGGAVQAAYETYTPITFLDESAETPDWSNFTIQAGVTVTPTEAADGDTVTVTGYSFDPSAVEGTTVLPDRPAGAFALFGRFPDVWQPSEGITSASRKYDKTTRKWAVLAEDLDTIHDDAHPTGGIELNPNGTFTTTIEINREFTDVPATGNFGIYTYAGDVMNAYAPFETYTPITEPAGSTETSTPTDTATATPTTTATGTPGTVDTGLQWGFKQTWRNYVGGSGTITFGAPAEYDPTAEGTAATRPYLFPITDTSTTGATTKVGTAGTVTFTNLAHGYQVAIGSPSVTVGSDSAKLDLDLTYDTFTPGTAPDGADIETRAHFADVADVAVSQSGSKTVVTGTGVTLTAAGAAAFNGFYAEGTALDDFTLTYPTTGTPPVVAPGKADSTATLKLAKKKVKVGKKAKATVRVKAKGTTATGKVLVKKGKKVLRTVTLKAKHDGKRAVKLPKLKKGKHRLRAVYQGSATVKADTSKKVTLRVVKKKRK